MSQDALTKARVPTQPLSQTLISSRGPDYVKDISVQGKAGRAFLSQDDLTKAITPSQRKSETLTSSGGQDYGKGICFFLTLLFPGCFDQS